MRRNINNLYDSIQILGPIMAKQLGISNFEAAAKQLDEKEGVGFFFFLNYAQSAIKSLPIYIENLEKQVSGIEEKVGNKTANTEDFHALIRMWYAVKSMDSVEASLPSPGEAYMQSLLIAPIVIDELIKMNLLDENFD